jgi:hypothetical protein
MWLDSTCSCCSSENVQGRIGVKDLTAAFGKQPAYAPGPIQPIELFRSLKVKPGSSIKELWAPQADALKEWHENRAASDTLFQLNTGAGKTLIGLVAAQSLVNETRGKVLYCCATRQLVEQTREKAAELGLSTATYLTPTWVDQDTFQKGEGPAITTYAALLNGKSIFRDQPLVAAILDDAHTAHDNVRSAFTLSIERGTFSDLYDSIVFELRDYFEAVGREFVFDAVVERRDQASVLMVPMFEVARHADAFRQSLLKYGAEEQKALLFTWAHIGENLDRCALLFDGQTVQFTPLLPPVSQVRAFRGGVRRLYLSATLRVNEEFIRTFGRVPDRVITPGGRAGDTERLVLYPPSGATEETSREWADEVTRQRKAVIMVPSWGAASAWSPRADVFRSEDGHERIRTFAASKDQRLVFVARYDGIDLPDEDCRIMVVDGLPAGMTLLDRFFEQHLERAGISASKIASRFVQLLGRTSRGMSDYGVVLLVGRRLLNWVLPPANRAMLPVHVQRQLAVGERLSSLKDFTSTELLEQCLKQTGDWASVYEAGMRDARAEPEPTKLDRERDERLATAERRAADAIWTGDYATAARDLLAAKDEAFDTERNLGAWFLHWAGFAIQMVGEMEEATELYGHAAAVKRDLGAVPRLGGVAARDAEAASRQSHLMAGLLQQRGTKRTFSDLEKIVSDLANPEVSARAHEEAIRLLGEYLAYEGTRPDSATGGKGPDDLWEEPGAALVMFFDAKTKMTSEQYGKELIGLSAQHALWVTAKYPTARRLHYIVGPRVPATPQATPPPGLRVVELAELVRVATDVLAVYQRAVDRNLPLFYAAEIEVGLAAAGLTWEALPGSMETVLLEAL